MLKAITVFCGTSLTCPEVYNQAAAETGRVIARQGRTLVYGSSNMGLMGLVARNAQAEGGYVIGINARRFADNPYPLQVDEYYIADTIQDRKMMMMNRGDACIAIPGGMGTLDEITEMYAMAQVKVVDKPFGVLNVNGFFDGFLLQVKRMEEDGFLREGDYERLVVAEEIETLLKKLDAWAESHPAR